MIQTNVSSDPRRRAAQVLTNTLAAEPGTPTLLLLAGGSALEVLKEIDPSVLDEHATIMMMDERFSADPAINNYLQFTQTDFYRTVTTQGVTCLPSIPNDGETLTSFRERLERTLKRQLPKKDRPRCIALFGIGPDGHTAGIFPMEATAFADTYKQDGVLLAAVTDAPNEYSERVSITPHFITEYIDVSLVYAVGQAKRPILQRLDEKAALHTLPAHIHSQIGSILFTDQLYTS